MICSTKVLVPSLALAGAARSLLSPHCTESLANITASATNFDLSALTLPPNATIPVSGTFQVKLRFCEPTIAIPSRANTLQVLVHGATYNEQYMDSSFEPETYSYLRWAAQRGYPTLDMDRLGAHTQVGRVL